VALATVLIALCPTQPQSEVPIRLDTVAEWGAAQNIHALTAILDDWLDVNSAWARPDISPRVRFVSEWEANSRQGLSGSFQRGRIRGLYDAERSEIMLVRPWNPRSAEDVSILLHELVHHRQNAYHWYCPAAQELPAYRLQEAWLAERRVQADVNWLAVVLDAGCAPRDIHPD
jgi:hypothetical protein